MILPSYKRLRYTDYPAEAQKIVEQLSYTVNNSFEDLYNVVNGKMSIRDNLQTSVNDISLTVSASGTPTSTASYSIPNSNTIDGTQVIKAVSNGNTNVYVTGQPFITFSQNGNKITLVNITGLPAGTSFTIRVVTFLT